jgi:hypothetical protein
MRIEWGSAHGSAAGCGLYGKPAVSIPCAAYIVKKYARIR